MANGTEERNRHFVLEGVTEVEPYRSRRKAAAGPTSRHATAKGTAQVARDLKNTCKGNLFVIFGEPDIDELLRGNGRRGHLGGCCCPTIPPDGPLNPSEGPALSTRLSATNRWRARSLPTAFPGLAQLVPLDHDSNGSYEPRPSVRAAVWL